jgi:hypothetical protein
MSYLINTLLHPLSIFLGVLLVFIGAVCYYFNNKLKEQNLKIDSIASVVSTMAMRNIQTNLTRQSNDDKFINLNTSNLDNEITIKPSLINVSDSDNNNSSDDDSQESSYETESDGDGDGDVDGDGYETDASDETSGGDGSQNNNNNNNNNNNKILKHDYESLNLNLDENIIVFKIDNPFCNLEDVSNNLHSLDIHEIEEIEHASQNEVNSKYENNHKIEVEVKEDPVIENVELLNVETEQLSQNNTIDLEKDNADILLKSVEVDYKKMSLNKLKEIALEKGLIDETTKLKKQDLLKLLSN